MTQTNRLKPLNFRKWIEDNRHLLKPPVGNAQVWEDAEFMVTVVGGPNARNDYHIDEGEEFFHQLEGDITLRILPDGIGGKPEDIRIREGDIFLLPARIPHSPMRGPNTIGLVLERKRLAHELDTFLWVCDGCGTELYRESFHLTNIVTQLKPVFEKFWGSDELRTCRKCGRRMERPGPFSG